MTKTSVFKLVSMKKGVERTHLEKLLMRLRLEHDELGQRTRYIDQVTQEYEVDLGKFEEAVRFDGPALAGRRYLVQLMSMKNAVVIKQMDLELKMERVRNALQQISADCQRFDKLDDAQSDRLQRETERILQREEDDHNLMVYNNRRGNN
jgi:hypothetical protein